MFLVDMAEVSNQMLELYEQNRAPPQASEGEGAPGGGTAHRSTTKTTAAGGEQQGSKPVSSHAASDHSSKDSHGLVSRDFQTQNNYSGGAEMVNGTGEGSVITVHKLEVEMKDNAHPEHVSSHRENLREDSNKRTPGMERTVEHKERSGRNENAEAGECKDDGVPLTSGNLVGRNVEAQDVPVAQSPKESGLRIDKLKDKIAQRRKERSEPIKKKDVMDEDDLIERELEHGVELAVEDEKIKREHRQSSSKNEAPDHGRAHGEIRYESRTTVKGQHSSKGFDDGAAAAEEGEMLEGVSPMVNSRKRKGGSSPDSRHMEGKKRHEYTPSSAHNNGGDDGHRIGRSNHGEKEHRRHHAYENHL